MSIDIFHVPIWQVEPVETLPWVEFFLVQPELNPQLGAEFLIQLTHGGFVIG